MNEDSVSKLIFDLLHVRQICAMLSGPLDADSGAMRKFH